MSVRLMRERIKCTGLRAAQESFELGECHFNLVQIGTVGRQKQEPISLGFQQRLCRCGFVRRQVVGNRRITGLKTGDELGFDIDFESGPVYRRSQRPVCSQLIDAQPDDEDQFVRLKSHPWLAPAAPLVARAAHPFGPPFCRNQRSF